MLLGLLLALPAAGLTLRCQARHPAGLWWTLQLLAGDRTAQTDAMRAQWSSDPTQAAADAAQLASFAALRARHRGTDRSWQAPPNPWVPALPPASAQQEIRFAELFLGAADWADLHARAQVQLGSGDAAQLADVVEHFAPRWAAKWQAATHLPVFCGAWEAYATQTQLARFVDQVASWMGVSAEAEVVLDVVPAAANDRLTARFLGNHLLVEVRPLDQPRHRGDEVVHELVHWLQDRAGTDREPAMLAPFFAGGQRAAAVVFGLWQEALATAIGQGVWQQTAAPDEYARSLERPLGWYTAAGIDALAKAVAPALATSLATPNGYRAFVATALTAGEALPAAPGGFLVRYAAGSADPAVWQALDRVLPPRAVWRFDVTGACTQTLRHAALTVVAVLRPADAPSWRRAGCAQTLHPAAWRAIRQGKPGVWQQQRASGARLLVVTGHKPRDLAQALGWLALQTEVADGFTPVRASLP